MHVIGGGGEGDDEFDALANRQALLGFLEPLGKARPLAVGGREVRQTVDLADLVHRHQVGMFQLGGKPGLAKKSLRGLIGDQLVQPGHFQRDLAAKFTILRQKDETKAPLTKRVQELKFAKWPGKSRGAVAGTQRALHGDQGGIELLKFVTDRLRQRFQAAKQGGRIFPARESFVTIGQQGLERLLDSGVVNRTIRILHGTVNPA